jgi:penicillin-binding protein 1A
MDLFDAIASSVNTIFAQLALTVGPENVADVAERMGVLSPLSGVCSITLGTQAVTPMDMTAAYATLAARGMRRSPHGIAEVRGPGGATLATPDGNPDRAVSREVADIVTHALRGVIEDGTGTLADIGRPAAGKTGTAENYQDAWFCGYVRQLATCVWVGYPEGEIEMHDVRDAATRTVYPNVYGGSIPAAIWHDFMAEAVKGTPPRDFAPLPDLSGYERIPKGAIGHPFVYGEGTSGDSLEDLIRELLEAGLEEAARDLGADLGQGDEGDEDD